MSAYKNESEGKALVPIARGWFSDFEQGDKPYLRASRCNGCGEVFFPKEDFCLRCFSQKLEEIALSQIGTLYSFTIVRQQPPIYRGPVPYALGTIELPEKIRIASLVTGCDFSDLQIGMKMELILEKLHTDDAGNDVVCYKFKPRN